MNRRSFLQYATLSPLFTTQLLANDDVYLSIEDFTTLTMINTKLKKLKRYVGFANFNLLSYEDALFYARNYTKIGSFSKSERDLIEQLFYEDPTKYGFYGSTTCVNINNKVSVNSVIKIPHTGHYLYRYKPLADYESLKQDIGSSLILTSGVRNVVKQLSLYVNKICRLNGNMTKASLSIAPPAYSYHTISDFDVGKIGWGYRNFTSDFATTEEFEKMTYLNYIGMRYKKNNKDGVRYEPWHVEVI